MMLNQIKKQPERKGRQARLTEYREVTKDG